MDGEGSDKKMKNELIRAGEVQVPYEVIVHSRTGKSFRVELFKNNINPQTEGYQLNALGRDPCTGRKVSLAPATKVELARQIVT